MMKKMMKSKRYRWYTLGDKGNARLENKLKRMVKSLYRFCERHGIDYCDLYILSDEGNTTLNIRAKQDKDIVVNSYAFVR